MPRKTYTREFKIQAARMISDQGLSLSEVARRLGVGVNCVRNWRNALRNDGPDAFPVHRRPSGAVPGRLDVRSPGGLGPGYYAWACRTPSLASAIDWRGNSPFHKRREQVAVAM